MNFISIDFALFLPVVFLLYWFVLHKNIKAQNFFLATASYVFYGWWDWRFLLLILFSTLLDYTVGREMSRSEDDRKRKVLLWISIIVNIGFLGFFKYYNFFVDSFVSAFSFFGQDIQASSLNIILPVGISFYTFQTLSYSIDIYKRKLEPSNDFVAFAAFVSFFPQLVAGPIERASNLLPQFFKKREFDIEKASDGMRQILWGLFKKIVIGDNCAEYANLIFNDYSDYSGSTLVIGAIFFTFHVYGDFSGYSDIAIGTARLFGFNLMQNFAAPYFSRDIAEFWRRWHISLSSWFRDYVYIPLGGSRGGIAKKIRNVFIIYIISGFWHGANWTYVAWGALNAIYFLPLMLSKRNRKNLDVVAKGKILPSFMDVINMAKTLALHTLALIVFRSATIPDSFFYMRKIFSPSLFVMPVFEGSDKAFEILALIVGFMIIEWFGRDCKYGIEYIGKAKRPVRWFVYYFILMAIFFFSGREQDFMYFQF